MMQKVESDKLAGLDAKLSYTVKTVDEIKNGLIKIDADLQAVTKTQTVHDFKIAEVEKDVDGLGRKINTIVKDMESTIEKKENRKSTITMWAIGIAITVFLAVTGSAVTLMLFFLSKVWK